MTLEIETTRDIAHQIIRHRSFSFQEFSQRYANIDAMGFTLAEARLQDAKNRQASIETQDSYLKREWEYKQSLIIDLVKETYDWGIKNGIAKECARKVLPEGLTNTRLYMAGTLRSWLHYCIERTAMGTQKEHREVAESAVSILNSEFPSITGILNEAK
jgi:thymidylate synthase (FAD)